MDQQRIEYVVNHLRLLGRDTSKVEVKSGVGKSILETLSAFSNTSGGLLLVGLSEESGFQPVENFDADKAADQLETRAGQLQPPVNLIIHPVVIDDVKILAAEIPEMQQYDKPCYIRDRGMYSGSFKRISDGDVRLTDYEVNRLREEKTQPKWDEELVTEAGVEDLDPDRVEALLARERRERTNLFKNGEAFVLDRLGIAREGSPTLAALLALGDYPQQFFRRLTVTFALYPGTDRAPILTGERLIDSRTLSGSIPELVDRTLSLVHQNMRTAAYFEDAQRREVPEYPLVAVREAIVNALMHRDYSPPARGAQVQVDMFVDRLEIQNPGGLFGAVTIDQLGNRSVSSTRNQLLAYMLENTKDAENRLVAENRGTGITVINKALAEALMPPAKIESSFSSFRITFYKRRVAPAERNATAKDYILKRLEKQDSISVKELMLGTKYSRGGIQKALSDLVADNTIEKTEPSRSPKQRYRMKL
ncbi:ATP-binding protein [Leucobacter sp. OH1287]|uniref:ATP-binding protein n=1 Tax=Leucobacter sp. OH1287 TaxID=2491049 RepID=UPI000F5F0D8E|nr:ATP-binding protein [Leucobacter sp. OH1287]RRD61175.1 DNA-binding protein [Leucobacter sp. OH1287]